MGTAAVGHPTDEVLQSYGLGKLDDVSSVSVSKHLESCSSCQRRVAQLSSDDFLGRLRHAQVKWEKSDTSWSPSVASSTESTPGLVVKPLAETLPPELVDHPDYEIVRELGRGGMGVVYLAKNRLMERPEVLKVVGRHLMERPGVLDRFLREIRSAARLHHPNIVTAYAAMRLGPSVVLAMEYVEGLDLAKMVKTKGPLPIAHACFCIQQAALGMQHAHECGMVHRDIKPANLILARDGKKPVVKVLDFGLAKVTSEGEADSSLTREGQMLGTPDFIAPEQIRNAQSADIRADIYSLGCTFYYLLTGGPPFRGDHLWDVYQAHFSMEAGPLTLVRPEVPVELGAVVAKMMAKEPALRFRTPGDVARALTPFFKPAATESTVVDNQSSRLASPVSPTQTTSIEGPPTQPASPRSAPVSRGQSNSVADGVAWETLIAFKDEKPLIVTAKPKAAEPKPAPTEAAVRRPPWLLGSIIAASVFGVLVLGVIIYVATDKGRIKIVVDGPERTVSIDGETVQIEGLDEPITLRAGDHELTVERGSTEVETRRFVVRRGDNEDLRIEYEPKSSGLARSNRQAAPSADATLSDSAKRDSSPAPDRPKTALAPASSTARAVELSGQAQTQKPRLGRPVPVACWTFESDSRDVVGTLHGTLLNGAQVRDGRLYVDGQGAHLRTGPLSRDLREKTLEAWVMLPSLGQRGVGVISIENLPGPSFDAIVLGEHQPGKWMAGSEFAQRTREVVAPVESATPTELIHLAIVYDVGGGITIYRQGQIYGERYVPEGERSGLQVYSAGQSHVVLGLRHTRRGLLGPLNGAIEEARLYDRALTADEVAASFSAGVIHGQELKVVEKASEALPGAARSAEGKPSVPEAGGTALSFDGRTHVTIAGSAVFDMKSRDYTIFARIKTRRGGTIFSKTAPQGQWVPDGKAMFIRWGRLSFDIGWVGYVESQRKIDDGAWHEVAMTYTEKDKRVHLFVDGQRDGEKPLAPKNDPPRHVVRIGYAAPGFPNPTFFDGLIAEVRFFQRALNQEQIAALSTNDPAGDPALAHWRLDPLQPKTIRDETGHGHDGTPDADAAARSLKSVQPESKGTANGGSSQENANLTRQEGKAADVSPEPKGPLEEVAHVPIRPWSNVVAFSPDSERVAIDNFWKIKLVELNTGSLIRDIDPGKPVVGQFNCVLSTAIAADGSIIASYEGQAIKVWDHTGAQKLRDFEPVPLGRQFVDIKHSKQGGWVIGRSRNQMELRIWDLESGKEQKRYQPPSAVKSLDVHPNGRWVVSLHNDNVVRIWDARTGSPVSEFEDGTKKITRVKFSPGGRQLLCLSQGQPAFSVVNPENGEVIQVIEGPLTNVVDAAFFPSGLRIASVNADNVFRVWLVSTGQQLYSRPLDKEARSLGISPDGRYVVVILAGEAIVYRVQG